MAISITIIIIYVAVWAKVTSMYTKEYAKMKHYSLLDALFAGSIRPVIIVIAIIRWIIGK
jgi:hypothetical protein